MAHVLSMSEESHQGGKAGRRLSRGFRLFWWLGVFLAEAVPLSLMGTVGYTETWVAFDRYTLGVQELSRTHAISVPQPGDAFRNYTRTDRDLIAWHAGISELYDRINRMAVVGVVTDMENGLQLGVATPRGKKGRFYPKRDLPLLLYFLLSAAAYLSDGVHLALVVLNLNLYSIAICYRLKGLTSAFRKSADSLNDAQQAFLLLPLEEATAGMLRQQLCLQKLTALREEWSDTVLGISFNLPMLPQTITFSTSLMVSIAAATTVRAMHVIAYGCIPGLPRIRWREALGAALETRLGRLRQPIVEGAMAHAFKMRSSSPKRE